MMLYSIVWIMYSVRMVCWVTMARNVAAHACYARQLDGPSFLQNCFLRNFPKSYGQLFRARISPTNLTFAKIHEIQINFIRCAPSVQHFRIVNQLMLYLALTLKLIRTNFAYNLIQFWVLNVVCFDASVSSRHTKLIEFFWL